MSSPFAVRWTTPTLCHEVWIAPEQATATTLSEARAILERVLCHVLLDQLPARAFPELLSTLLDIREFYSAPSGAEVPRLNTGKSLPRLSRKVRPEIDLTEE